MRNVSPVGVFIMRSCRGASPSPSGRGWPEGPGEGRLVKQRCPFRPSPAASRHPLPGGEGLASAASHYFPNLVSYAWYVLFPPKISCKSEPGNDMVAQRFTTKTIEGTDHEESLQCCGSS